MFKKSSSYATEIENSMREALIKGELEKKFSFDNVSKAADFISMAATLLDDVGLYKAADELQVVLEKLAETDVELTPATVEKPVAAEPVKDTFAFESEEQVFERIAGLISETLSKKKS
jgi:hypothetical protein